MRRRGPGHESMEIRRLYKAVDANDGYLAHAQDGEFLAVV